jgi:hypothetical protein
MKSYIDGVLKGTKTDGWEPTSMTRSNCYIGKSTHWASDGYLSGEVSSLKLYSGAMTQADVTAAYETARLAPLFFWDFRSAASDTIIDSVGGVVATLTNGDANDRTATGITLNGVDGHIVLDLDAVVFGGAMTVEVIVTWNAFNSWSRAFDWGNGESSDNIFVSNTGQDGQLLWNVHHGSTEQRIGTGNATDLTPGVRHHIVTTVVNTTMRSYIDGVLKGTKTDGWEPIAMTRSNCYIGKSNWAADSYLSGEVSSLKLYSGAMTQADVTAAYAALRLTSVAWTSASLSAQLVAGATPTSITIAFSPSSAGALQPSPHGLMGGADTITLTASHDIWLGGTTVPSCAVSGPTSPAVTAVASSLSVVVFTVVGTVAFNASGAYAITCTTGLAANPPASSNVTFAIVTTQDSVSIFSQAGYTTRAASSISWGSAVPSRLVVGTTPASIAFTLTLGNALKPSPSGAGGGADTLTLAASAAIWIPNRIASCTVSGGSGTESLSSATGGAGMTATFAVMNTLSATVTYTIACTNELVALAPGAVTFSVVSTQDTAALSSQAGYTPRVATAVYSWVAATSDSLASSAVATALTFGFKTNFALEGTSADTITITSSHAVFPASGTMTCNTTCNGGGTSTSTFDATFITTELTLTVAGGQTCAGGAFTASCTATPGFTANPASATTITYSVVTTQDTILLSAQTGYSIVDAVSDFSVTMDQYAEGLAPTKLTFVFSPTKSYSTGNLQIDASANIFTAAVWGATCSATQKGATPMFSFDVAPASATQLSLPLGAMPTHATNPLTIECVPGTANPFAANPSGPVTFTVTWTADFASSGSLVGYTPRPVSQLAWTSGLPSNQYAAAVAPTYIRFTFTPTNALSAGAAGANGASDTVTITASHDIFVSTKAPTCTVTAGSTGVSLNAATISSRALVLTVNSSALVPMKQTVQCATGDGAISGPAAGIVTFDIVSTQDTHVLSAQSGYTIRPPSSATWTGAGTSAELVVGAKPTKMRFKFTPTIALNSDAAGANEVHDAITITASTAIWTDGTALDCVVETGSTATTLSTLISGNGTVLKLTLVAGTTTLSATAQGIVCTGAAAILGNPTGTVTFIVATTQDTAPTAGGASSGYTTRSATSVTNWIAAASDEIGTTLTPTQIIFEMTLATPIGVVKSLLTGHGVDTGAADAADTLTITASQPVFVVAAGTTIACSAVGGGGAAAFSAAITSSTVLTLTATAACTTVALRLNCTAASGVPFAVNPSSEQVITYGVETTQDTMPVSNQPAYTIHALVASVSETAVFTDTARTLTFVMVDFKQADNIYITFTTGSCSDNGGNPVAINGGQFTLRADGTTTAMRVSDTSARVDFTTTHAQAGSGSVNPDGVRLCFSPAPGSGYRDFHASSGSVAPDFVDVWTAPTVASLSETAVYRSQATSQGTTLNFVMSNFAFGATYPGVFVKLVPSGTACADNPGVEDAITTVNGAASFPLTFVSTTAAKYARLAARFVGDGARVCYAYYDVSDTTKFVDLANGVDTLDVKVEAAVSSFTPTAVHAGAEWTTLNFVTTNLVSNAPVAVKVVDPSTSCSAAPGTGDTIGALVKSSANGHLCWTSAVAGASAATATCSPAGTAIAWGGAAGVTCSADTNATSVALAWDVLTRTSFSYIECAATLNSAVGTASYVVGNPSTHGTLIPQLRPLIKTNANSHICFTTAAVDAVAPTPATCAAVGFATAITAVGNTPACTGVSSATSWAVMGIAWDHASAAQQLSYIECDGLLAISAAVSGPTSSASAGALVFSTNTVADGFKVCYALGDVTNNFGSFTNAGSSALDVKATAMLTSLSEQSAYAGSHSTILHFVTVGALSAVPIYVKMVASANTCSASNSVADAVPGSAGVLAYVSSNASTFVFSTQTSASDGNKFCYRLYRETGAYVGLTVPGTGFSIVTAAAVIELSSPRGIHGGLATQTTLTYGGSNFAFSTPIYVKMVNSTTGCGDSVGYATDALSGSFGALAVANSTIATFSLQTSVALSVDSKVCYTLGDQALSVYSDLTTTTTESRLFDIAGAYVSNASPTVQPGQPLAISKSSLSSRVCWTTGAGALPAPATCPATSTTAATAYAVGAPGSTVVCSVDTALSTVDILWDDETQLFVSIIECAYTDLMPALGVAFQIAGITVGPGAYISAASGGATPAVQPGTTIIVRKSGANSHLCWRTGVHRPIDATCGVSGGMYTNFGYAGDTLTCGMAITATNVSFVWNVDTQVALSIIECAGANTAIGAAFVVAAIAPTGAYIAAAAGGATPALQPGTALVVTKSRASTYVCWTTGGATVAAATCDVNPGTATAFGSFATTVCSPSSLGLAVDIVWSTETTTKLSLIECDGASGAVGGTFDVTAIAIGPGAYVSTANGGSSPTLQPGQPLSVTKSAVNSRLCWTTGASSNTAATCGVAGIATTFGSAGNVVVCSADFASSSIDITWDVAAHASISVIECDATTNVAIGTNFNIAFSASATVAPTGAPTAAPSSAPTVPQSHAITPTTARVGAVLAASNVAVATHWLCWRSGSSGAVVASCAAAGLGTPSISSNNSASSACGAVGTTTATWDDVTQLSVAVIECSSATAAVGTSSQVTMTATTATTAVTQMVLDIFSDSACTMNVRLPSTKTFGVCVALSTGGSLKFVALAEGAAQYVYDTNDCSGAALRTPYVGDWGGCHPMGSGTYARCTKSAPVHGIGPTVAALGATLTASGALATNTNWLCWRSSSAANPTASCGTPGSAVSITLSTTGSSSVCGVAGIVTATWSDATQINLSVVECSTASSAVGAPKTTRMHDAVTHRKYADPQCSTLAVSAETYETGCNNMGSGAYGKVDLTTAGTFVFTHHSIAGCTDVAVQTSSWVLNACTPVAGFGATAMWERMTAFGPTASSLVGRIYSNSVCSSPVAGPALLHFETNTGACDAVWTSGIDYSSFKTVATHSGAMIELYSGTASSSNQECAGTARTLRVVPGVCTAISDNVAASALRCTSAAACFVKIFHVGVAAFPVGGVVPSSAPTSAPSLTLYSVVAARCPEARTVAETTAGYVPSCAIEGGEILTVYGRGFASVSSIAITVGGVACSTAGVSVATNTSGRHEVDFEDYERIVCTTPCFQHWNADLNVEVSAMAGQWPVAFDTSIPFRGSNGSSGVRVNIASAYAAGGQFPSPTRHTHCRAAWNTEMGMTVKAMLSPTTGDAAVVATSTVFTFVTTGTTAAMTMPWIKIVPNGTLCRSAAGVQDATSGGHGQLARVSDVRAQVSLTLSMVGTGYVICYSAARTNAGMYSALVGSGGTLAVLAAAVPVTVDALSSPSHLSSVRSPAKTKYIFVTSGTIASATMPHVLFVSASTLCSTANSSVTDGGQLARVSDTSAVVTLTVAALGDLARVCYSNTGLAGSYLPLAVVVTTLDFKASLAPTGSPVTDAPTAGPTSMPTSAPSAPTSGPTTSAGEVATSLRVCGLSHAAAVGSVQAEHGCLTALRARLPTTPVDAVRATHVLQNGDAGCFLARILVKTDVNLPTASALLSAVTGAIGTSGSAARNAFIAALDTAVTAVADADASSAMSPTVALVISPHIVEHAATVAPTSAPTAGVVTTAPTSLPTSAPTTAVGEVAATVQLCGLNTWPATGMAAAEGACITALRAVLSASVPSNAIAVTHVAKSGAGGGDHSCYEVRYTVKTSGATQTAAELLNDLSVVNGTLFSTAVDSALSPGATTSIAYIIQPHIVVHALTWTPTAAPTRTVRSFALGTYADATCSGASFANPSPAEHLHFETCYGIASGGSRKWFSLNSTSTLLATWSDQRCAGAPALESIFGACAALQGTFALVMPLAADTTGATKAKVEYFTGTDTTCAASALTTTGTIALDTCTHSPALGPYVKLVSYAQAGALLSFADASCTQPVGGTMVSYTCGAQHSGQTHALFTRT